MNQKINIRTVGTGQAHEGTFKEDYLGSYMLHNGRLVFHVFLKEQEEAHGTDKYYNY
jgi:hypothetical protein